MLQFNQSTLISIYKKSTLCYKKKQSTHVKSIYRLEEFKFVIRNDFLIRNLKRHFFFYSDKRIVIKSKHEYALSVFDTLDFAQK